VPDAPHVSSPRRGEGLDLLTTVTHRSSDPRWSTLLTRRHGCDGREAAESSRQIDERRAMRSDSLSRIRIVVTGATGGIGGALVPALVDRGAVVAVTGPLTDRLDSMVRDHPLVFAQAANIIHEPEVADFFQAAAAQLGGIDVLVNLAGLSIPGEKATFPVESCNAMIDVNVLGTFLSCKHAIPHLKEQRGLIINVGSVAGTRPNATAPGYCRAG